MNQPTSEPDDLDGIAAALLGATPLILLGLFNVFAFVEDRLQISDDVVGFLFFGALTLTATIVGALLVRLRKPAGWHPWLHSALAYGVGAVGHAGIPAWYVAGTESGSLLPLVAIIIHLYFGWLLWLCFVALTWTLRPKKQTKTSGLPN